MLALAPRRRRLSCAIIASLLLFCFLYSRRTERYSAAWSKISGYLASSAAAPDPDSAPILRPEDRWIPPPMEPHEAWDWHVPAYDVYKNWSRIDHQYAPTAQKPLNGAPDPRPSRQYAYQDTKLAQASGFIPCQGPRGVLLDGYDQADEVLENPGRPHNFARSLLGSNKIIGLEQDVCFDRRGRYGAYGLDEKTSNNSSHHPIDWDKVDWAELQDQCVRANRARFDFTSKANLGKAKTKVLNSQRLRNSTQNHVQRTAVVFRSHQNAIWTDDVRRNMRAVIQELSLRTGGEYQAFVLLEVKDNSVPLGTKRQHQEAIEKIVPHEFRNITTLWNVWRWNYDYSLVPGDQRHVHMSQWLPMQYFQKEHPEFDFYWNWEMDVRYTGHYHELVRKLDTWSAQQPRKGLWERNARFYIPRLHGSWQRFSELVQARYMSGGNDSSIWGPQLNILGPSKGQTSWLSKLQYVRPPVPSPSNDQYEWGVGEPADFMTMLPQFEPSQTNYVFEDAYWNYPGGEGPDRPHDPTVPRRTTIITFSRVSARLLHLLELENTSEPGHHMASESWPQSVALHYGLKSVTIPHGVYMEQEWPAQAADYIFNNGDQNDTLNTPGLDQLDQRGMGSGGPESTFGLGREHNWSGSSWYYQNTLAEKLYKRWMGHQVDNVGGRSWEATQGLFCLPPMLLHPVKVVEDPHHEL